MGLSRSSRTVATLYAHCSQDAQGFVTTDGNDEPLHISGGRVFLVLDKVARDVRTPAVEGILRVPLTGFPLRVLGDVVNVVEVLGVAAPRILDVIKDVAADRVAAQPPGRLPAALSHPHSTHAHLVEAAHLVRGV